MDGLDSSDVKKSCISPVPLPREHVPPESVPLPPDDDSDPIEPPSPKPSPPPSSPASAHAPLPPISALDDDEITDPRCANMAELPGAHALRRMLRAHPPNMPTPVSIHLGQGLAYTVGSALGARAPGEGALLAAFAAPNSAGLSAGARAWSKHAHRSGVPAAGTGPAGGWWGVARGPIPQLNARALGLFWRVVRGAVWRNLHWLPHRVLVYEARVPEGYGMRWARNCSGEVDGVGAGIGTGAGTGEVEAAPWTFRGYVEPMMENGHEVGWKH